MLFKNASRQARKLYPQILAALAVFIIAAQVGILYVWSSPYIAQLTSADSPLPITLDEASWIASLLYLGRVPGAIIGAISVNFYGSKKSTFLSVLPLSAGWLITIAASSSTWLFAARFVLGIGMGFAYSCFYLYLGEVAAPEIRGFLVSLAVQGTGVGDVLGSVLGSYLSIRMSGLVYLALCAIVGTLLLALPDSPHHLMKMDDAAGARAAIEWYRAGEGVEEELSQVKSFVKASSAESFRDKLAGFKQPHTRKATFLVVVLFALMQLSGLTNVLLYTETILQRSQSTLLEPSSVVTYIYVCSVVLGVLTLRLYDTCGRRWLMIISCLGVSLSLAALGTHFALLQANYQWIGSQCLPVVSLFAFILFFIIGLNSVPCIVSSEVYAANVKFVAACIVNLVTACLAFAVSKSYQPLVDAFGEAYVFWGHAAVTFMGIPYVLFCMPETKNKSLQEIQDCLIKEKK